MRKSQLRQHKQDRPFEYFVTGTAARCTASLVNVNAKTSASYVHRLRELTAYQLDLKADTVLSGEIEVDEGDFGRSVCTAIHLPTPGAKSLGRKTPFPGAALQTREGAVHLSSNKSHIY